MDLLQLMREAREQLQPNWLLAIGVFLVYGMLVGVPSELNTYGELLSFLLAGPLQMGLCIFFLKIVNSETPVFFDLFEGFKPLLQVLLAYAVVTLLTILGLLFLIVPGIVISLGFSMTFYILAERPETPFNEAIQESWNLTNGYKMDLFILHLRFIPWYLLGLLFLIVGIFVVIPWHQLSIAKYYKYLTEQPVSNRNL
jgi:uncharacterized membrane protein